MNYHAHVYWSTPDEKATALSIRSELADAGCQLGRVWDEPIGPHPRPMYQVNYNTDIQTLVEQLLQSSGLTVLLHEDTGDDVRDHTEGARWLGSELTLDLVWLKNHDKGKTK